MSLGERIGVAWAVLALVFVVVVPAAIRLRDIWRDVTAEDEGRWATLDEQERWGR